jgi:hypothetical protein
LVSLFVVAKPGGTSLLAKNTRLSWGGNNRCGRYLPSLIKYAEVEKTLTSVFFIRASRDDGFVSWFGAKMSKDL